MSHPTIIRSLDFEYFNRMIHHPDIFPSLHDDVDSKLASAEILNTGKNIFLKVEHEGEGVGFAMLLTDDETSYEMHSGMLKDFRGRFALKSGIAVLDWVFIFTNAREVTTSSWSNARNVMWAASQVGFVEVSRSPWRNPVRGERVDLVNYSTACPCRDRAPTNYKIKELA